MNRALTVVLAIAAVVAAGATALWLGNRSRPATPSVSASRSAEPKASEVYASDGTTLIVRFDGDPPARCLGLPTASWGYFCDYLVGWWQAQPAFGADPAERLAKLRTGGYRITGSLDLGLQATALRQVESVAAAGGPTTFSVATVAPGTGLIRALAVNQRHGPPTVAPDGTPTTLPAGPAGTTFMMFTAVAALEAGIPLDRVIETGRVYKSQFRVGRGDPQACGEPPHWCPVNVGDKRYLSGRRTVWEAFTHTVLTYFVALEETVGTDKVVDVAQRLGIQFITPADRDLASKYANMWGAFTLGVSQTTALDLANAYATLAADGLRCDPRPVQAITDVHGSPVAVAGPNCRQAVTAEVARAAVDAGRCAVGDRSAVGAVCGPGVVPASRVLGNAGRPVTGQLGTDSSGTSTSLVVASPGLSTAGMLTDPSPENVTRATTGLVQALSRIHHDGLAGTPVRAFPPPPESLARAHS
jgi:membrane peptidoglycan carboxypeptidase